MHWHFVLLASFFMQFQPPARAIMIVVLGCRIGGGEDLDANLRGAGQKGNLRAPTLTSIMPQSSIQIRQTQILFRIESWSRETLPLRE
jgi:hypothetical protein